MIINPRMPTGHVVFCDDIREEIGGKRTFVGVYGNFLVISAVGPVTLPQLCAAISLRIDPPTAPTAVTVRIFRSDGDELLFEASAEFPPTPSNPSPFGDENSVSFIELFVPARMQNLVITQDCAIKVRAFIGDDEIRLGAIVVSFVEPASGDTVTSAD
ncbi:hypothetical protein [Sphingopyxis sp. L1A2A]|uniref:DUF6941 family protein n=1 Tax=Sphingopyxis sp. L1A2A TaxID=2502247 RepID=UPI0010F98F67|nr:hypothetical protein [Sphingopyxis sp. L1A2A]